MHPVAAAKRFFTGYRHSGLSIYACRATVHKKDTFDFSASIVFVPVVWHHIGVHTKQIKEEIPIAITSASLPAKKRILTVCVRLFLEMGYKKTTMAEIIEKADVSYSTFQNIFRAKDGVLTELAQFMFANQFAMARDAAGTKLPPVYVYAVETAIQITLTELNENLREIYIESYTQAEVASFLFHATAKELYRISVPIGQRAMRAISTTWRSVRQASCAATWHIPVTSR